MERVVFFSNCVDHQGGFTRAFRRTAVISLTLNPGQEVQNDLILEKYLCHICVLQIVRVFIFICEAEAEFDSNFVCVCVFQCFWRVSVLKYSYISLFFFVLFCCADSDEKKDRRKNFKNKARVQLRTVMDLFFLCINWRFCQKVPIY